MSDVFDETINAAPNAHTESPVLTQALGKASARLLPLLFTCYIVAYLDRVNIGFAKLQMASALQYSDAVYGFGAGIFFIGYFVFEVPSNLILERVGARVWIARIMVTWGIVSGAFAFIEHIPWGPLPALFGVPKMEFSFYALRLLLGVAEAGFFPGIILYLTYWFPRARRARTVALFMTAVAVANVVGGPVSGAIMQFADGALGWHGWRWLFVLEALPSLVAGVVVLVWLPDGPESARWLSSEERAQITRAVSADHVSEGRGDARVASTGRSTARSTARSGRLRTALMDGRVWAMSFVYLATTIALYGVNFWMPTIIQEFGIDRADYLRVGLISMIPWGVAGVAMVVVGAHSDRTGERRWHTAGSLLAAAVGLALLAVPGMPSAMSVVALTIITCGVLSCLASFWSLSTGLLTRVAAAAGIAMINSVGNLGGHFGPDMIGRIRNASGSSAGAFLAMSSLAVAGAIVTLAVTARTDAERPAS